MKELVTTPYNFMWRVKNPQDYWANSFKEVKCIVYLNGKKLGKFCGINRTFDDDMYYLNYYKENGDCDYRSIYKDTEIVLEPIKEVVYDK